MPARPNPLVEVYAATLEQSCGEERQYCPSSSQKLLLEISKLEFCPGWKVEDHRRKKDRR
uniref:Uncharacterized protein n=1 Tax=Peronospora matthiolae TaxID=2874970 RepID=A0AAV1V4D7_9STRA